MKKSSLFSHLGAVVWCFAVGVSQPVSAAPLTPVSKKPAITKKVVRPRPKKAVTVTPPPAPQTFDTIEDEDLVLIPENEVFATVVRPSTIESSAISVQESTQPAVEPKPAAATPEGTIAALPATTEKTTESSANPTPTSIQPVATNVSTPSIVVTPQSYEYYRVENKDINTLTYRLRIVQAILEESGKAYDYRSLKTRELIKILNRVRADRRTKEMNAVLETPQLAE